MCRSLSYRSMGTAGMLLLLPPTPLLKETGVACADSLNTRTTTHTRVLAGVARTWHGVHACTRYPSQSPHTGMPYLPGMKRKNPWRRCLWEGGGGEAGLSMPLWNRRSVVGGQLLMSLWCELDRRIASARINSRTKTRSGGCGRRGVTAALHLKHQYMHLPSARLSRHHRRWRRHRLAVCRRQHPASAAGGTATRVYFRVFISRLRCFFHLPPLTALPRTLLL